MFKYGVYLGLRSHKFSARVPALVSCHLDWFLFGVELKWFFGCILCFQFIGPLIATIIELNRVISFSLIAKSRIRNEKFFINGYYRLFVCIGKYFVAIQ